MHHQIVLNLFKLRQFMSTFQLWSHFRLNQKAIIRVKGNFLKIRDHFIIYLI
jgi:uncharacterized protein YxjI